MGYTYRDTTYGIIRSAIDLKYGKDVKTTFSIVKDNAKSDKNKNVYNIQVGIDGQLVYTSTDIFGYRVDQLSFDQLMRFAKDLFES